MQYLTLLFIFIISNLSIHPYIHAQIDRIYFGALSIITQITHTRIHSNMDIEVDRERIINKFKRNGNFLNKSSLEFVSEHLRSISNPNKRLDEIIKKMNQMKVNDQQELNDGTLKLAIQLLQHRTENGKTFSTYDKFLEHLKKWTIFYINPYESNERFFVDKPDPTLFQFVPQDYMRMNLQRFKQIRDHNVTKLKNNKNYTFIGVLFEKFQIQRNRIMLQNQLNQIELVFPQKFQHECFLIPGCTYIAEGEFKNRDLQLTLTKLQLPFPLPHNKNNLFSAKFKLICDNISLSKDGLDYSVQDFKKYEVIYNKDQNKGKPIMMFGNVKINVLETRKIKQIVNLYPNKVQCLILLIAEGDHEEVDLKKEFGENVPVFIVPNINSEGPRILPKPPILKHFYNAKVVTNPAKFLVHGKECLFLNYPLVKNLYSKSLIPKQINDVNATQMAKKVSSMLYSQNNVAVTNKIFWKQSPYFDISSQDLIFISDKACPQVSHSEGGEGGFISIGDFQRDREFVCFMPHIPNPIQLCENKQ